MIIQKKVSLRNSDKARNTNITKRANKKLDYLADIVSQAAGDRFAQKESSILYKKLFFRNFRYLNTLELRYNWQNRFFSVSYNLELNSEVVVDERFREIGTCSFQISYKGMFHVQDAEWVCKQWVDSDNNIKNKYLESLNNQLIIDRIIGLDMQNIEVLHIKDSTKWSIRCESMIGSATWMFIPPMLNLITPSQEECVKFLEVFELIADAVVNNASYQ